MWIIPKNLDTLASVQDTQALISDLDELSALCEQSLLARSNITPRRIWLRRLRRDYLTSHLSGRILRPSHGRRFTDEWTSSLGASLASRLAPPVGAQETETHDTYGHTSSEGFESWADLPLFSSRMLMESSAPSSQAPDGPIPQGHPFCSMSSESWSAWLTGQRQEYSRRARSARRISVSACSFLACEMTSTPARSISSRSCLSAQGEATSRHGQQGEGSRNTHGSPQELQAATQTPPLTGQINPRWVETLMGLPVGWAMATCAAPWTVARTSCDYSGTGSSPPPQNEPSASSGSAWPTPQARDHKGSSGRSNAGEELDLPTAVRLVEAERHRLIERDGDA